MIELCKFKPEEIDEAIEGMDGLQKIIVPVLRQQNYEGMAEQDIMQFQRHIMLAKHALIAMGDFLESKMGETENIPLTLDELRMMDTQPVYVTSAGGNLCEPWYIVDLEEMELNNPWDRIVLNDWDSDAYFKAYRRKP